MPVVHDTDQDVADRANARLAEWGRRELSVTASQVVRWNQSKVFGVTVRGGKHQKRDYPPDAADVAAALAIALDRGKERELRLDSAILAAAADGARIAKTGIDQAYNHVLRRLAGRLGVAKAATDGRAPTKRSQRIALPGKRRSGDELVRKTVRTILLGQEPDDAGIKAMVHRLFGPDVVEALQEEDGLSLYRQVLGQVALAKMRRTVIEASRDDFALAARTVRSIIEFTVALSRHLEVTQSPAGPPIQVALAGMGRTIERLRIRPELAVALTSPVVLIATPLLASARGIRVPPSGHLEELSTSFFEAAAQMRALTGLAESLPPQWRPCFGHDGVVVLAKLDPKERDELLAAVREWLVTENGTRLALSP
jgi:hypothetical protein